MFRLALSLILTPMITSGHAQLVAIRTMKEPVEGICDLNKVYSLMPFQGQQEQQCSLADEVVESLLNERVTYVTNNPKFRTKKYESVSTMVNCNGELVLVELNTKSPRIQRTGS